MSELRATGEILAELDGLGEALTIVRDPAVRERLQARRRECRAELVAARARLAEERRP